MADHNLTPRQIAAMEAHQAALLAAERREVEREDATRPLVGAAAWFGVRAS